MGGSIRVELRTSRFRFLWLKHVSGFDERHHCAKGLVGRYAKLFPYNGAKAGSVFEGPLEGPETPFLYLCGVTGRWADNLHVAMAPDPGGAILHHDANCIVRVEGWRRLEIPPLPPEVAAGLTKDFTTCRNYQFGHHYLAASAPRQRPLFA